jgi:hypothetical protein
LNDSSCIAFKNRGNIQFYDKNSNDLKQKGFFVFVENLILGFFEIDPELIQRADFDLQHTINSNFSLIDSAEAEMKPVKNVFVP